MQSGFLQIDSGHVKFLKHVLHASKWFCTHWLLAQFVLAASPFHWLQALAHFLRAQVTTGKRIARSDVFVLRVQDKEAALSIR